MSEEREEVEAQDLDELDGEPLPDREAMSILPVGVDPVGGITLPVEPPVER